MGKANKAHTAAANRIAARYGTIYQREHDVPDIQIAGLVIEVETTVTLVAGIRRLKKMKGSAFVAVTNQEALPEALRRTSGTQIGVMDPQGEIVQQSNPPYESPG